MALTAEARLHSIRAETDSTAADRLKDVLDEIRVCSRCCLRLTPQRLEPACNISLSQIRLLLRQGAADETLLQGALQPERPG